MIKQLWELLLESALQPGLLPCCKWVSPPAREGAHLVGVHLQWMPLLHVSVPCSVQGFKGGCPAVWREQENQEDTCFPTGA